MNRPNWPKCPKCKSQNVRLVELYIGHSIEWMPGDNPEDGILENGDPYKVECNCLDCQHTWRKRGVIQMDPEWFEPAPAGGDARP